MEARPFSDLPALVRVEMNRKADVGGSYPLWFVQLPQAQARTLYRQHRQVFESGSYRRRPRAGTKLAMEGLTLSHKPVKLHPLLAYTR